MPKLELLEKYAQLDIEQFNDEFEINVESRRRLLKEDNHKYLDGLLSKKADLTPLQTCMYLEDIDTNFGLNNLYGKHIIDAPLSTFATVKSASIRLRDGTMLTEKELEVILTNEKTAEYVSDDLLTALNSDNKLKIFSLIPEELQTLLKGLG